MTNPINNSSGQVSHHVSTEPSKLSRGQLSAIEGVDAFAREKLSDNYDTLNDCLLRRLRDEEQGNKVGLRSYYEKDGEREVISAKASYPKVVKAVKKPLEAYSDPAFIAAIKGTKKNF